MKNLVVFCFLLTVPAFLLAQTGKVAVKPVPKVTPAPPLLKTLSDSVSYAIGLSIASFCKQQGITKPNTALVSRSCSDVMTNKTPLLSGAVSEDIINKLLAAGKPAPNSITKPVATKALLKNANDSVSYAIGLNHFDFFKTQGITKLNTVLINKAVTDILGNKPLLFDDRIANNVMNKAITLAQDEKVKPVIEAGRVFLENNRKKPGVITTASGLQYEIVKEGTGARPALTDTFVCHYRGTLLDGTEFDNSYKRNQPLVYPVLGVIRGWTEGLQLMQVGSKYNFYVPYELGYGSFGNPPVIPGGSVLIFELELLDVRPRKAADPKPGN